jgi:ketosteroid isomerase-like protein
MARGKTKSTKGKTARGTTTKRAVAKRKPTAGAKRKPAAKKRAAARGTRSAPRRVPEATRAFARRIIDATLGDRDDEIVALYADGVASSEAGRPPQVGLDALREKLAGWRTMTLDTRFEPHRVVVDGNVVVIEWVGRVTLAATGRTVEMREVAVHEIENGKIVREAFYYDPAVLA